MIIMLTSATISFRREHLTEEDVKKNKAIVTSIQRGTITCEDLQVR